MPRGRRLGLADLREIEEATVLLDDAFGERPRPAVVLGECQRKRPGVPSQSKLNACRRCHSASSRMLAPVAWLATARAYHRRGRVNILILGGGGREHALAWAFAQNPKCDRLWCAPGQRRHRRGGDLRRARHPRRRQGARLLPRERRRLRDDRPGGAAGRGRRRRAARRRRADARARPRGGAARGLEGLHQGDLRRLRRADRRRPDLHRPGGGARLRRGAGRARSSSRPTASPPARA